MAGQRINDVAISPDGTLVAAGSNDDTLRLWDGRTGETVLVHRIPEGSDDPDDHSRDVNAVAFSPSGDRLAVGIGDHSVQLRSTYPLSLLATMAVECWWDGYDIHRLSWSPDGKRVRGGFGRGESDRVGIWDVDARRMTTTMDLDRTAGKHVGVAWYDWSPDGRRLVTSSSSGQD
jgi:WD40 repeat protein